MLKNQHRLGKHCFNCCLLTFFFICSALPCLCNVSWQDWLEKAKAGPVWVSAAFVFLDVESSVWWQWSSNSVYPAFIQCLFGVCLAYILSEVVLYPGCCGPSWMWLFFLGGSFSHGPSVLSPHLWSQVSKSAFCGSVWTQRNRHK